MAVEPYIVELKGNSLDDGPGIRTVVFFKGCPLSCVWCHNPESMHIGSELSFDGNSCTDCGQCATACPSGAASLELPNRINREICETHFSCTEVCPSGALSPVGRKLSPEQLASELLKDRIFYETSGGGVTLSGGEATLFPDYVSRVLGILKAAGVHILLETSGFFNFSRFESLIYPFLDMIYFDVKLMDSDEHKLFCGVKNDIILDNFRKLHSRFAAGGVPVLPRTPLIPGITATESNIRGIANWYKELGVEKAELLSYNPLWPDKVLKMGFDNPFLNRPELKTWMTPENETACRNIFRDTGISLVGDELTNITEVQA